MKILLLEDDIFICESIKSYFELLDNQVDYYNDGEELLDNSIIDTYDILLLDINTPKKNGFETLKEIRDLGYKTPAIFITAQSDIDHVKEGYKLGCSDYVRKPFILEELELRIKQIIHEEADEDIIKLNKTYSFNISNMQLLEENKALNLSKCEKNLLYILVKNLGNTVSPEIIKNYVWDEKDVCDNTLRTQIKKLRSKIKDNLIINVRNSGYKIDNG